MALEINADFKRAFTLLERTNQNVFITGKAGSGKSTGLCIDEVHLALEINADFKRAFTLLERTNQNVFITGKAGSGKSTFLEYFKTHTKRRSVFLAPTGVAALNIGGQTLHSFFHFYIDVTLDNLKKKKVYNKALYQKLDLIVIDEVSMVRADLLDCVDVFLRLHGSQKGKAFGGVQMVFVGDLYQLPPVVTGKEKEIFTIHYQTPYFFSAHVMKEASFEIVDFEKIYRQKDIRFIELLNKIRNNSIEQADIDCLNKRVVPPEKKSDKADYIHLTTTNKRAQEVNDCHLAQLEGRGYCAHASLSGDFGKEYYPTLVDLSFKIGAQIMLLTNDQQGRWVNGSLGVVKEQCFDEEEKPYLSVQLEDNLVSVYPHVWEVYRFVLEGGQIVSMPVGTFTQYPFRLAWAITIHKSQGKTFDHVMIDLDRGTFVSGQMYVALSAVHLLLGLHCVSRSSVVTFAQIIVFLVFSHGLTIPALKKSYP